jgi:hypothetical protein
MSKESHRNIEPPFGYFSPRNYINPYKSKAVKIWKLWKEPAENAAYRPISSFLKMNILSFFIAIRRYTEFRKALYPI